MFITTSFHAVILRSDWYILMQMIQALWDVWNGLLCLCHCPGQLRGLCPLHELIQAAFPP